MKKIEKLMSVAKGQQVEENRSFCLVIQADEQGKPVLQRGFQIPADMVPPKTIVIRCPGISVSEKELKRWTDRQIEILSKSN